MKLLSKLLTQSYEVRRMLQYGNLAASFPKKPQEESGAVIKERSHIGFHSGQPVLNTIGKLGEVIPHTDC